MNSMGFLLTMFALKQIRAPLHPLFSTLLNFRTWAGAVDFAVIVPHVDVGMHEGVIDADPLLGINHQHLTEKITGLQDGN